MIFLVYVSSAVHLFSDEELVRLLEISRRNNTRDDIGGMLLYKDGNFMQCLEGPEDKVNALLRRVQKDPRHRGVLTLVKEQHVKREFPDWSMGFKNLQNVNLEALPGYTDFLDLPLTSEQYIENPSKALQLLFNFKNSMR
jgi:hypothetical protein